MRIVDIQGDMPLQEFGWLRMEPSKGEVNHPVQRCQGAARLMPSMRLIPLYSLRLALRNGSPERDMG